jgi:hypothetical protein
VPSGSAQRVHLAWPLADVVAQIIVRRALRRIGARRPRWHEGQREYTRIESRATCAHCERPITRESFQTVTYCSETCRQRAKSLRQAAANREEQARYSATWRAAHRERGEVRACQLCGRDFRALDYAGKKPQRFCSLQCRSRFASQWAASWRPNRIRSQDGRSSRPAHRCRDELERGGGLEA